MPVLRLRRLLLVVASLALAVLLAPANATAAAVTCDRYAGPFGSDQGPGTQTQPYATAQRLADVLTAGKTGCLLAGTYDDEIAGPYVLSINHGGAPGAPLTIRSAPGQRATLRGIIYVPEGSNYVTLSDVDIDARRPTPGTTAGIQILGNDTVIQDSTITNHRAANCMILGVPGWGQATRTVIQRNIFRECGGTENIREHAIYVEYTDSVLITDNLFVKTGAYAVHLYPEAKRTTVTHNVMVDGGGGVIFAGEDGGWASRDSVVEKNIITGSWQRPGIHAWWGGPTGTNNVARDNCLKGNLYVEVDVSNGGFTSTNNIIANPQYRDAAAGDYRLAANSPCLAVVGYDTVAKIMGETPAPTPTPTPSPTPSPAATQTATPAMTAAPTATSTPSAAPTATPTRTPTATPTRTPTATPSPASTPTAAPTSVPVVPDTSAPAQTPQSPPLLESPPETQDPDVEPVEAAVFVDARAFSFSGGSTPKPCTRRGPRRCR